MFRSDFVTGFDVDSFRMTVKDGDADSGRIYLDVVISQNLAGFPDHLHFFLGVTIFQEDIDLRQHIEANLLGIYLGGDRLAAQELRGLSGEFLDGWQYTKEVTWASGLDDKGRPLRIEGMEPTVEGKRVCPSLTGASNWYSTAYNPATGLYYLQTEDKCGVFTRVDAEWEAGKGFMGGSFAPAPEPAQRLLRAIDIQQGSTVFEVPQTGRANSWGGVLSTAGGVVFFGDDSGAFTAVDANNGAVLWSFAANARWRASPMTYEFDGRQYIGVANGSTIMTFALPTNGQ